VDDISNISYSLLSVFWGITSEIMALTYFLLIFRWATNGPLRTKYTAKMAGMGPIAKPKGSKKMKDWDTKQDD
jgi:hypothetical protein